MEGTASKSEPAMSQANRVGGFGGGEPPRRITGAGWAGGCQESCVSAGSPPEPRVQNPIPEIAESLGPAPIGLGDNFGWTVGGSSNGLVIVSAPFETLPSATVGAPAVDFAGWAVFARVNDQPDIDVSKVVEATEHSITVNQSNPNQSVVKLRKHAFFGAELSRARPAFVPIAKLPPRYGGTLNFSASFGGGRLGSFCQSDTVAPTLSASLNSAECLWPPNKNYASYRLFDNIAVSVDDDCDPSPTVRVVDVEVIDSGKTKKGKSHTQSTVFGDAGFCLLAARNGKSDRLYRVTLEAKDLAGNTATTTVTLKVPKSASSAQSCSGQTHATLSNTATPACLFR